MCYDPALVHDKPLGAPASVKLAYSFTQCVGWNISEATVIL